MLEILLIILAALVLVLSSSLVYFLFGNRKLGQPKTDKVAGETQTITPDQEAVLNHAIVAEARAKAKEVLLEARDNALKAKEEAEEEVRKIKEETIETEKKLAMEKTRLETQEKEQLERTRTLKLAKEALDKKQEELDGIYQKQRDQLEKVAGLTKEEAQRILLEKLDRDLIEEKGKKIREMEEDIKKTADTTAKEILMDAMRYGSTEYVAEHTTSKIKLPEGEEIKGRIIGKEGRNIQYFEELTGVELDLDSAEGEVIVSSFDSIRREVAKVALERLIADGRIQPAKIEEVVEKTKKEIEQITYREGDNLCHMVGVYNLDKEIVQTLGKFKYRFSYGQNLVEHTLEVTKIGMAIAHELKVDLQTVKLGCLLHDIGKVISDEEGSHVQLGIDFLKKFNIDKKVMACIAEHHEDKPYSSVESSIVGLADHISGARPGSRSESYENYAKRMGGLEEAARSFDGVNKVYAISAGREVRVFVEPKRVDDSTCSLLAREIAKKIELEQNYPGTVKVTVIRETRYSETAK